MQQHVYGDFSEPLVQEIMADMANNFFGSRKQLETMIDLFSSFLETLKQKGAQVDLTAAFLNYLLLDKPDAIREFYSCININLPGRFAEIPASDSKIPSELAFTLTAKGTYSKIVLTAYDELQRACNEYINGRLEFPGDRDSGREQDENVYYKLIIQLGEMINKRIKELNRDMSPVAILQYAKHFDPDAEQKENITGGYTFAGYSGGINEKLAFKPIDMENLDLKEYPILPKQQSVYQHINRFCNNFFGCHSSEIKMMLTNLKKRDNQSA